MKIADPSDPSSILELCIQEALGQRNNAPRCGVVAVMDTQQGSRIVYSGAVALIPPLTSIWNPLLDKTWGNYAHAAELALWKMVEFGYSMLFNITQLYSIELDADDKPIDFGSTGYRCIRCGVQMHYAKILGINIWMHGDWSLLHPYVALQQAYKYNYPK